MHPLVNILLKNACSWIVRSGAPALPIGVGLHEVGARIARSDKLKHFSESTSQAVEPSNTKLSNLLIENGTAIATASGTAVGKNLGAKLKQVLGKFGAFKAGAVGVVVTGFIPYAVNISLKARGEQVAATSVDDSLYSLDAAGDLLSRVIDKGIRDANEVLEPFVRASDSYLEQHSECFEAEPDHNVTVASSEVATERSAAFFGTLYSAADGSISTLAAAATAETFEDHVASYNRFAA